MLNKKCFVLDLDGTVYLGDIPIQETVDFILRHWDTIDFHFLSNNTSKAPTTYVNKLTRMGIPATLDRILSPVTPLIAHLRGNGIRTQLHCEEKKFKQKIAYADKLGIPYVIFLGEDEISAGVVACKDMATGEQTKLEPAATVYRIKAGLAEREKGTVIQK